MNKALTITASLALLGAALPAQAGTGYEMRASTIAGSSATLTSGGYTLRATAGQQAGIATQGDSTASIGFWGIAADSGGGCNPADLAPPLGTLDLADITAFVTAFTSGDQIADLDNSGLFDLADITAFVGAFTAGCP